MSVGPVPIEVEQQLVYDYTVSFKPPQPDDYEVNINWGGRPVPGSPFTVNLLPPAKPDKVECADPIYTVPGEIAELLVDISNAGSGMLTAQCSGRECREVSVDISDMKIAHRTYQVSFTPLKEDIYTLSVFFEGTHVKGSPFTFDMSPGTVPPTGVIKMEERQVVKPQKFEEGKPVAMDIDADCKLTDIGSHAIHEKTGTRHRMKITRVDKGKFKLSFQPKELGIYSIHVQIKQKDISGSPFRINYGYLSKPENCVVYGLSNTAEIGKPATFTIDARKAGSGELNIMASGPSRDEKPELSVTDNNDGTFSATCIPHCTWRSLF